MVGKWTVANFCFSLCSDSKLLAINKRLFSECLCFDRLLLFHISNAHIGQIPSSLKTEPTVSTTI